MIFFSSLPRIMSSSNKLLSSKPKLFSLITSKSPMTTTTTRSSGYPFLNSTGRPPLMVSSILDEIARYCPSGHKYACHCGDDHHHLVAMMTNGLQYENEDQIYQDYVKALAPIVGSEEEAKKKIYLVSCGDTYGFGVELESRYMLTVSLVMGQ